MSRLGVISSGTMAHSMSWKKRFIGEERGGAYRKNACRCLGHYDGYLSHLRALGHWERKNLGEGGGSHHTVVRGRHTLLVAAALRLGLLVTLINQSEGARGTGRVEWVLGIYAPRP